MAQAGIAKKEARTKIVRRWRRNMDVQDDMKYVEMLTTLSEGSVRRNFNPYTDIDWDSPEFAVVDNDPRWVLPATDPLGRHPWYQSQPVERQIEIGMWRQANVAKVGLHFESILIRGLMEYSFWTPNGSPEYRYCLHEAVEECNHTLMFQEMVNRIGADVPGMPRLLKWVHRFIHLVRTRVPAQACSPSAAAQALLVVALRPAHDADPVLGHHRAAPGVLEEIR